MSRETLLSKTGSCTSLDQGAKAAVVVSGLELATMNREMIEQRIKDVRFGGFFPRSSRRFILTHLCSG